MDFPRRLKGKWAIGSFLTRMNVDPLRILLALDESEHSQRAVNYVGSLLRDARQASLTLFHVLKPLPRELLEHGGSENPSVEGQLSSRLRKEQEAWYQQEQDAESTILRKAREGLEALGVDSSRVAIKFGYEEDVARNILEEARSGNYSTIVVGRQGASGAKRLFGGGVTDQLLREANGFALWVIE